MQLKNSNSQNTTTVAISVPDKTLLQLNNNMNSIIGFTLVQVHITTKRKVKEKQFKEKHIVL